jgi:LacI family repressor for deo operon, udp, cdd, tsx, nupC, and nupG
MANIRDIAALAGVSVATVSRALSRPEVVKSETIAKVEAAIKALEYAPNAMASGLRRRKSDTIVIVVPDIHNPFYSAVIQGTQTVASENDYKVLLGETKNDQVRLDRYTEMLIRKEADGLILLGSLLPTMVKDGRKTEPSSDFALVFACEYQGNLKWPRAKIDNFRAAMLAVRHLTALGHKIIAKITGPMENPLSSDRLAGFEHALRELKLTVHPELVVSGDFSIQSGYRAMKQILAASEDFTAVFCSNDEMAIGAMRAIDEAGLRVPDDVSVVGFDNIKFAEYASPPLTTIAQPNVEIGETAMALMLGLFRGDSDAVHEVILPHRLVARSSSGRVRRKRRRAAA